MIQIVKRGTERQITTCRKCGCIFIYDREDIKYDTMNNDHCMPGQFIDEYVNCPQCNEEVIVKPSMR